MTNTTLSFEVRRDDLADTRTRPLSADPAPGEVLLQIDRFALTANTVTYASHGDAIGYWDFYPADDGWGRVPAWGTATVTASRADGFAEGDRLYGFLTMAGAVAARLAPTGPTGFTETSSHRANLPAVYNRYRRLTPAMGDERLVMLLQPLHATAFLLDDFLAANDFFGAKAALISSASSKTALAVAHAMSERPHRPRLVGLTSPRNAPFTIATGAYDEVIAYADVTARDPKLPTIYIDIAGDRTLRATIHRHFHACLMHSAAVGDTHQGIGTHRVQLPGPPPQFFFAPTWLAQRQAEWGAGAMAAKLDQAWMRFAAFAPGWLHVVEEAGPDALARRWTQSLEGGTPPSEGLILSLA